MKTRLCESRPCKRGSDDGRERGEVTDTFRKYQEPRNFYEPCVSWLLLQTARPVYVYVHVWKSHRCSDVWQNSL